MAHITEDTVTRLRDRITEGVRITSSYFQDHRTPFSPTEWFTAEKVAFDKTGRLTVTYRYWSEKNGKYATRNTYFNADDMIALAEEESDVSKARLTLPGGGYMDACGGGNLRIWDVYAPDGTQLARELGTVDARDMLAEYAPEMIWVHKGDGNWIARGHGRAWKIARDGRNPDYNPHTTALTRYWFYTLSSRPLDGEEWTEVAKGCKTPEEAREAAPAPQDA
jgi:hypothetical protein